MITTSVQIREHHFELHPLRALWWAKHDVLICADVHIGKGEHFRNAGIPIPKAVNSSNLWNLVILIEQFNPRKLLFLGDLFHSRLNSEWAELSDCLAHFPNIEYLLVKGNHEIELQSAYEQLGFSVYDELTLDGVRFTHEPPTDVFQDAYTISGHIHPAVRMQGSANQSLRLPCFWFGQALGILPAFGEFTGSFTVRPKKGDIVFVIAENRVVRVE
jgi:DNA ligase-associated metallophosphoesterase